jgi:hypothetical protein
VRPQNPISGAIVDVSVLAGKLAYLDVSFGCRLVIVEAGVRLRCHRNRFDIALLRCLVETACEGCGRFVVLP